MQRNARIGSESILVLCCVATSVNARRRNATYGVASYYCEPTFREQAKVGEQIQAAQSYYDLNY